jgi:uncharacterized protein involved in cysteine biosynthesis
MNCSFILCGDFCSFPMTLVPIIFFALGMGALILGFWDRSQYRRKPPKDPEKASIKRGKAFIWMFAGLVTIVFSVLPILTYCL